MPDIASFNTVEEIEQLRKWQKEYMGKFQVPESETAAAYEVAIEERTKELIKRAAVMPPMPVNPGSKTWIQEAREAQEQSERTKERERKALEDALRELQAAEVVRKRKEAERLAKEEEEERKARILEELAQTTDWDL
jgi:predicted ATP-dependent endonuclease of OLD family